MSQAIAVLPTSSGEASQVPAFVALLRGVNVGNARRVPMVEFRSTLAGLGYTGVVTRLNSGNAVFRATGGTPARHAASIAAALAENLKLDVPVIVKSARELATIVAECPINAESSHHSRLLVAFVQERKALAGLAAIERLIAPPEQFAIGSHAAYLYCAAGILQSEAGEALLGKAGRLATTRNWATVLKLQALAATLQGARDTQH
jgi:uncharacterized protein (DUF1697 family)